MGLAQERNSKTNQTLALTRIQCPLYVFFLVEASARRSLMRARKIRIVPIT
jgi:hypothetical protein